ncbi:MAG: hypothetical protein IJM65_00770 [Bacteroidales bacterium]|nr:hypothetical protein [Bacteroidales bacterium]
MTQRNSTVGNLPIRTNPPETKTATIPERLCREHTLFRVEQGTNIRE